VRCAAHLHNLETFVRNVRNLRNLGFAIKLVLLDMLTSAGPRRGIGYRQESVGVSCFIVKRNALGLEITPAVV
jgi:hypothetical protein